jgi:hypothetical protein
MDRIDGFAISGRFQHPKTFPCCTCSEETARIGAWWNEAVSETIREMERATLTRMRRNGAIEDRVTGNFVAATVTHDCEPGA